MSKLLPEERTTLKTYDKIAKTWAARHNNEDFWVAELKRFFAYWSEAEFIKALNRNQFTVVDYVYRPDNPKTRWHCFFVKNK